MRVKPDPKDIAEVYIDESSQNNHRFLVLGGLVLAHVDYALVCDKITKARSPELPKGEAKWTKVSKAKLPAYKRIVDVFFDNPDGLHFHSLTVDTTKLNHRRYNDGSREIGFNKEIYQLGIKVSRLYRDTLFHVYPDRRHTTQQPDDLRLILNRGCRKHGDERDWPFRRVQFRDSKLTLPLQLTDVLIGAIAFRLNGHDKADDASQAKIDLSAYVLEKAKIGDVTKGTARTGTFTIWPRQLR